MPFSGRILGKGIASQADCPDIPYQLVEPRRTPENLLLFGREIERWTRTARDYADLVRSGRLGLDVAERADFGVQVLQIVQTNVELGSCCQLLAVDPEDRILGAMVYVIVPPSLLDPDTRGTIVVLASDPRNMPGSPYVTQVRGVGTALVATAAQRMLSAGVKVVYLHPLDQEALRFWMARGFRRCGAGSLLCVRGQKEIGQLIDGCFLHPEAPIEGEFLLCGLPNVVRRRLQGKPVPEVPRTTNSFAAYLALHSLLLRVMQTLTNAVLVPDATPADVERLGTFLAQVLTPHARAEEAPGGLFAVARMVHDPGITRVLRDLEQDHQRIDGLIGQYQALRGSAAEGRRMQDVRAIARQLQAQVAAHFREEDSQVIRPLEGMISTAQFAPAVDAQDRAIGDWLRVHGWPGLARSGLATVAG